MRTIASAFKQALKQVFRNHAMSIASLFSITAMLLILGLFFVIAVNINMVTETARAQFDTIQIYLEDSVEEADADRMASTLRAMPEVSEVEYVTKDQAMEEYKVKWGDNAYLLEGLTKNPLPNSLRVTVKELEGAKNVVTTVKTMSGIEDIKYYQDVVERLIHITDGIQLAAMILIAFLILVSVIVVQNTIKLTVVARADEINIMKYVGATSWFIRLPFLFEGMLIGFFSAAVAAGLIALIYTKLLEQLGPQAIVMFGVSLVPADFLIKNLIIIFMALGLSIGAAGSIVSMRRFLDNRDRA
ncbi:MAG: permease-like cell division protein FtsX [Firmicutes bacterium]|nr:permease-like cell division protein FtsX [Bacillota bacterium]